MLLNKYTKYTFCKIQENRENTKIYLDSNLGKGKMKGEEFAEILHKDGYKNIFLTTGYDFNNYTHLQWLTCVRKICPFI